MKRAILDAILAAQTARRPVVLLTWLDGSRQEIWSADSETGTTALEIPESVAQAAAQAARSDRALVCEVGERSIFVQPLNPTLRLVIVGAVHIGQHLAVMARSAGYAVTVVDPRSAFASRERFPDTDLSHEWPDVALRNRGLDRRTAVVTLTHDPKLDDPALLAALESPAFYVGSLGSRSNHARRLARLREEGIDESALGRIHGPVGLAIGARSPAEIAVSILAQMTARLREAS